MNTTHQNIRWIYLVLGVFVLLFSGVIYAWSILKAPLADVFGWTALQLSLNYTLTMIFFCLGGIVGSVCSRKLGIKTTLFLSALLSGGGLTWASFLSGGHVLYLYLSYGVLCGFGIGVAYNTILSTICAWFPDKMGLCSGCLMMGFGASAMLIGNIADAMIRNPHIGWRAAYLFLGLSLGVVLFLAALILRRPEESAREADEPDFASDAVCRVDDCTPVQLLKSPLFWFCFFYIMLLSAVGSTVISFAKDISLSSGADASLATWLVGVISVCNGIGRVVAGVAIDVAGERKVMVLANLTTFVAAILVLFSLVIVSVPLGIAGLCLTGLSYGANPSISSTLVAEFFGTRFFSSNLSLMGISLMGTAGIATVAGLVYAKAGSFTAPIFLLVVLTCIGTILNICIWRYRLRVHGRTDA